MGRIYRELIEARTCTYVLESELNKKKIKFVH